MTRREITEDKSNEMGLTFLWELQTYRLYFSFTDCMGNVCKHI